MEVDLQRCSMYLVDRGQKKFGHPWYTNIVVIITILLQRFQFFIILRAENT